MKNTLNFLIEIGKLKGKERRGWQIHKIKNSETTAEHIFHLVMLVWVLNQKRKLNLTRMLKLALVHDMCEVYSPDFTSYDAAGLKEGGRLTMNDVLNVKPKKGRPTIGQRKKLEKIKKRLEAEAIKKITINLSPELKKEIKNLWTDYENGLTSEGRFVKQADRAINLLQGLEYWKKYGKIEHKLWVRRAKEVLDDPVLLEFIKTMEKKFCSK